MATVAPTDDDTAVTHPTTTASPYKTQIILQHTRVIALVSCRTAWGTLLSTPCFHPSLMWKLTLAALAAVLLVTVVVPLVWLAILVVM